MQTHESTFGKVAILGLVAVAWLGSLFLIAVDAATTLAGCPILPADNVWNTPIDRLPVDVSSAAYIQTIGADTGVHPDFGSGTWDGGPIGIPYNVVPGSQPKVPITFDYDDESDPGPYPIPDDAAIEGGPESDGDRHILILDQDNCLLYETFATYPEPDGSWSAGSGAIFDLRSNGLREDGWTSADAAGLPILPGLIRYEEVEAGEINHAIRFTAPQTRREYIWPARHYASSLTGAQYPPLGQRFRLKADFDISGFSPEVQVILQALKTYGMILADNGSSWFISGVPDERWNNDTLVGELRQVVGSDFEAVDESSLMVDPDSGRVQQTGSGLNSGPPSEPVRLIFIHHSCGENWLADDNGGLGVALMNNNYFVSDTNYGWGPESIGDHTDIGHWWLWFGGPDSTTYLSALYMESEQHSSYSRLTGPAPAGEKEIIMFKSCFPNSALQGDPQQPVPAIEDNPLRGQDSYSPAHTITNAKGIYIDLLEYFRTRQDKLFIAIAAPPLSDDSYADNARAFNNWLTNDWLRDYPYHNVAVFDFYNVLTTNGGAPDINDLNLESGNHHRLWQNGIQHQTDGDDDPSPNVLEYPSGDDHPSRAGNRKATGELLPLLNIAYHCWQGTGGCVGEADKIGVFRPSEAIFFLSNNNTDGVADIALPYGLPHDQYVTGDWDGDGVDTVGIYRDGVFHLNNSNEDGTADLVFSYGIPGDQPIAGDWDGDGIDTIGVYRNGLFMLRNTNDSGPAEMQFALGIPGDVPIAGNWDGAGGDSCGVFRPTNGLIYLKNENSTGYADIEIVFGIPNDKPIVGDWDGDGIDTIGVYREGAFLLRNSNETGYAEMVFALGINGDVPISGKWGLP